MRWPKERPIALGKFYLDSADPRRFVSRERPFHQLEDDDLERLVPQTPAAYSPHSPGFGPRSPGLSPHSPGLSPYSSRFGPSSPGFSPKTPVFGPHSPGLSQHSPGLSPSSSRFDPYDDIEHVGNEKAEEIVVTWDGPNDPMNPMNWPRKRKWIATLLVSMFTFISPFSSTMVTPALPYISKEFSIPEGFTQQLVMSIFLLGYAQGPFVLAPLSEIFGRITVLQYSNLIYLVFNTMCGFAQNRTQLLVFRFLSGIGGSAPQALGNGVLADTWSKEERGLGQSIYGMLTFIGPCVAPICGAYISMNTTWRWIFWSTSMFCVLVQVLALLFLPETFAPTILSRKADKIRAELSARSWKNPPIVRTEFDNGDRFSKILRKRLILPFIMLFTHPAVQAPSVYRAYLYGVMYLLLSTFPMVFKTLYHQDAGTASLNYLSLCLGFMIGLQISHPLMDKLYAWFKVYYNQEEGVPEWRVPPMLIGGILCPIGLLIYGWTAYYGVHWIVPNIGCVLIATGLIIAFQCTQAYTVDAYTAKYAASAAAVGAFTRTMCGFSFPLFAPQMYKVLGVGWGNSLLALLTLILAILSPVGLWFYGPKIRAMSTRGLDK